MRGRPPAPKIIPRLLSRRKCSGVVELRSLGSLHLCIDSHLCRCIVQRLCVAVFMHPCITTLCDRYRASLHDPHSASSPPSTKKSRAMPVCVSGSVAGCRIAVVWVAASCSDSVRPLSCILCTFMNALLVSHPCETLGVHFIRHPCLTRKLRVLPPAAPKNNTPLVERAKV